MDVERDLRTVMRRIIKDIQVDLGDEFDQNFERQAYFNEKWQRRKSPIRPGRSILVDSSKLSGSIQRRRSDTSVSFYSDVPYAAIHNNGGEIVVTERMKRYFWWKFYQIQKVEKKERGGKRRKLTDGGFYAWTSKMRLSPEAEFYRAMALMKVGSTIKIPRRQFMGGGPEVERICQEIIDKAITKYIESLDLKE